MLLVGVKVLMVFMIILTLVIHIHLMLQPLIFSQYRFKILILQMLQMFIFF